MKARVPKQNMGGGAQNMNAMIKQAQKMQDEITKLQDDIEERAFTAPVGGGQVEVVLSGKKTIKSLTIKPEVVNEAIEQIENTTEEEMSKITGGVSLPGLF